MTKSEIKYFLLGAMFNNRDTFTIKCVNNSYIKVTPYGDSFKCESNYFNFNSEFWGDIDLEVIVDCVSQMGGIKI